jgi:hypothetical protein
LGLDRSPSATTKLFGELVRRQRAQNLLLGGLPPRWRLGGNFPIRTRILELGDELCRFIVRELPSSLSLSKAHWAACVAEVGMSCLLEKVQKFSNLPCGGWRTCLLTKRHVRILAYGSIKQG